MTEYTVTLLDNQGYELSYSVENTLSAAKKRGAYLLSDAYRRVVESDPLEANKVEVRNEDNECVWDCFRV